MFSEKLRKTNHHNIHGVYYDVLHSMSKKKDIYKTCDNVKCSKLMVIFSIFMRKCTSGNVNSSHVIAPGMATVNSLSLP